MEIVSYYVGKGVSPEEFVSYLVGPSDENPFDDSSLESEKKKSRKIKKPLFASRFFEPKDFLFDLSGAFLEGREEGLPPIQAIYNQTSGRLVVHSSQGDHVNLSALLGAYQLDNQPVLLSLKVEVYEFPRQGLKKRTLNALKIPESAVKLAELESKSRIGERAVSIIPGLNLEWESNTGGHMIDMDLRLNVLGAIHHDGQKHEFSLMTGVVLFPGIPTMMELGNLGSSDKTLVMSVTNSAELLDGTPYDERIIVEGDQRSNIQKRLELLQDRDPRIIEVEGGKIFGAYAVPPFFAGFIHSSKETDDSDDPFADTEEDHTREVPAHFLVPVEEKATYEKKGWIVSRPGDRFYNLKELFARQGLLFKEGDFIILNENSSQLFALLLPSQMELLDAIVSNSGWESLRLIQTELTVLESDREFGLVDLDQGNIKRIARVVAHGRNGDKTTASLEQGHRSVLAEIEQHAGGDDGILDVLLDFKFTEEKVPQLQMKSGVTLRSGQPRLVQKHRHEGKWRALLVRSEVRILEDDLDE